MKLNYKHKVLIFIIIIKVLTFIWFLSLDGVNVIKGFWGFSGTESFEGYLLGMENFIKTGNYSPDIRMPGYGLAFLLPRVLTDRAIACNILIVFQLIMGIISTYLLAEIAFKIYKTKLSFILTGVVYSLCISVSSFESSIGGDSLAVSISIIGLFYFYNYIEKVKIHLLIFSALLIAWAIFIRPIMGVLWGVIILYLIISAFKSKSGKLIIPILFFIFPFFLFESIWTIRNYRKHNEFDPLNSKHLYHIDLSKTKNTFLYPFIGTFVASWGGNIVMWNPNSEVRWFGIENRVIDGSKAYTAIGAYKKELPGYIYTSKFNKDSLVILRDKIQKIWSHTLMPEINLAYCDFVNKKLLIYTNSIKEEKPFIYYVFAPLRITKTFLFTHGTQTLINKKFSDLNVLDKIIKLIAILVNIIIVSIGLLGLLAAIIKRNFLGMLFIPITFSLFYIFYIGFIFKLPEVRFLIPLYPFLLISSLYILNSGVRSNKIKFT